MRKTTLTLQELSQLKSAAEVGRPMGWRPYSNYAVGAALLTVDGRVYGGCGNVECANYTLTKHAEETVTIMAISDGALLRLGRKFIKAVYIPSVNGSETGPCGGCRQFLWEFSDDDTLIISENKDGNPRTRYLKELLPEAFGPGNLGIE